MYELSFVTRGSSTTSGRCSGDRGGPATSFGSWSTFGGDAVGGSDEEDDVEGGDSGLTAAGDAADVSATRPRSRRRRISDGSSAAGRNLAAVGGGELGRFRLAAGSRRSDFRTESMGAGLALAGEAGRANGNLG